MGVFFAGFLLLGGGVFVGDDGFLFESAVGVFCVLEGEEATFFRDVVDLLGVFLGGGVFRVVDDVFDVGVVVLFLEGLTCFLVAGEAAF